MKCKLCETECGRITYKHLAGSKCKDDPDLKRRITVDEYHQKYGAISDPENSTGDRP